MPPVIQERGATYGVKVQGDVFVLSGKTSVILTYLEKQAEGIRNYLKQFRRNPDATIDVKQDEAGSVYINNGGSIQKVEKTGFTPKERVEVYSVKRVTGEG